MFFSLLIGCKSSVMALTIKEGNGFKFIDEGQGEVVLLLHGLFGALSN